jgi:hypothetical protein
MISANADFRREDFYFARQQSRYSVRLEKLGLRRSWLTIAVQICAAGAMLFLISQFILWCYQ